MPERQTKRAMAELTVVLAAVILHPSGMAGVLIEVPRADMMMLAIHHPTKAG